MYNIARCRSLPVALVLSAALACTHPHPEQTAPPSNGTELLSRMHQAYDGKWFRTLTFTQQTTMRRPDGTEDRATWYEAVGAPDRLRIDIGDPALGNGSLYASDSQYVIRDGKVVRSRFAGAAGNPFIPFVEAIYTQPLDRTMAQIAPLNFDLTKMRDDQLDGRPVYVVGARDASDLESPQFWVDRERLVAVRLILPLLPKGKSKSQDFFLERYVPVGGGWLATRIRMLDGGEPFQTEDYSDWKANVPLSDDFFRAESWSTAPHWAKPH